MCWPICENCHKCIPKAYFESKRFKIKPAKPYICRCHKYYWPKEDDLLRSSKTQEKSPC